MMFGRFTGAGGFGGGFGGSTGLSDRFGGSSTGLSGGFSATGVGALLALDRRDPLVELPSGSIFLGVGFADVICSMGVGTGVTRGGVGGSRPVVVRYRSS